MNFRCLRWMTGWMIEVRREAYGFPCLKGETWGTRLVFHGRPKFSANFLWKTKINKGGRGTLSEIRDQRSEIRDRTRCGRIALSSLTSHCARSGGNYMQKLTGNFDGFPPCRSLARMTRVGQPGGWREWVPTHVVRWGGRHEWGIPNLWMGEKDRGGWAARSQIDF